MPKYFDKSSQTLFNCRTTVADLSALSDDPDTNIIQLFDAAPAAAGQPPAMPALHRTRSIAYADQERYHSSGPEIFVDTARRQEVSGCYDETESLRKVRTTISM